jgi:hypothetical protein
MSRKVRLYVWLSWVLLAVGVFGWPVTQLTIARDEPPFVLGLSWLAIIVTALGVIVSADVRKEQDKTEDDS